MSIRFDEKGKFFTDIVSKEVVPVVIQTLTHQIRGSLHVRPSARFKDEINQAEQFFAITEATILTTSGEELMRCEFIAINRDHIVWLLPQNEVTSNSVETSGGEA